VPRPKTQSDEQVLDAALVVVREHGIGSLTFAVLARQCGLASATLVQRFGNKPKLTQRMLLHAWDELDALTRELGSLAPLTPEGAVELLLGLSKQYGDSYAEGLLLLREDVRDPLLRRRGVAWEAELTAALDARFASVPNAPEGIGYALAAFWQGSVTWWAFRADPPLEVFLADRLRDFVAMVVTAA
jgi:AcrR family transcriptional regulator